MIDGKAPETNRKAPEYQEDEIRQRVDPTERETEATPNKTRQAVFTGHMRYVLWISIALVVIAFLVSYAVTI